MRIPCPLCGDRDSREFRYLGSAVLAQRPGADADDAAWHAYVHLRDNPAGENAELWQHVHGCRAWIEVLRNVSTHAVLSARLAGGQTGVQTGVQAGRGAGAAAATRGGAGATGRGDGAGAGAKPRRGGSGRGTKRRTGRKAAPETGGGAR